MSINERVEELKRQLFIAGYDAISNFLGYDYPSDEDKDVTENRLDQAIEDMTETQLESAFQRYGI